MELKIEKLVKSFEEKSVIRGAEYSFEKERYMVCLEETEPEKQHCLTA